MLDRKSALLPRQVIVSLVCVVLATVVEVFVVLLGEQSQQVTLGEVAAASAHLFGFYAPVGLLIGLVSAPLFALLGRVGWLQPLTQAPLTPRDLFRARPDAFAKLFAGALVVLGFLGSVAYSSHTFATRFHSRWLAAGANALAVVAIVFVAAVVFALLLVPLKSLAHRFGRLASVGVALLVGLLGLVVGFYVFATTFPAVFLTYRPGRLAFGPVGVALFLVLSLAASRVVGARPERRRKARIAALVCAGVSVLGLLWVALGYGHDNRTRHVVEDRTLAGGSVVRLFMSLSDRDGDGFSFAFGGDDCDDRDPSVYPGAPDPRGDGVDSDCFAGDGGPLVAELGDGHPGEVPGSVPRRPNVLLLSIDALRPDHLGFNGYERPTSPRLDAFAATAVRFDNTYAASTRSIRSMTAMMTGLYPSEIRFGSEIEWTSLDPSNVTLAELLAENGWQTSVSIGATYFERSHGFFQGFETVEQREDPSRSGASSRGLAMIREMAAEEAPWLAWIHLMNVHGPYLPDGRASRFGSEVADQYDEEIVLADEQVGHVLDALEEEGLADDTIVVIFSDHGEAFGEHGAYGHTSTLYEEEVRAVLMIRAPGVAPRSVDARVGLIDVFPTVLNLTRQRASRPIAAQSLVPLMTGAPAPGFDERVLIAEILPDGRFPFDRKSIIRGSHKLHWWVREGRYQLFDIANDPGEEHDLSTEQPEIAEELLGLLRSWSSTMSLPEHQRRHAIRSDILERPPARFEHPFELAFQDAFTLLGCNIDEADVRPGGALSVECFYRVDEGTSQDYQFVVEAGIPPPPEHPRLHHMRSEHYPLGGRYMTSEWRPSEIIRDRVTLTLPDELRVGTTVTVRLQVRERRAPLPFEDSRTTLSIGTVRVRPGR